MNKGIRVSIPGEITGATFSCSELNQQEIFGEEVCIACDEPADEETATFIATEETVRMLQKSGLEEDDCVVAHAQCSIDYKMKFA